MEIIKELQYSIKWYRIVLLLLETGLQVSDTKTVMERMKSFIGTGIEKKILLKANIQEKEVL